MRCKVLLPMLIFFLASAAFSSSWSNPPPRPVDYRGFVYINGEPAPDGTVLEIVFDASNTGSHVMNSKTLQYGNGYFNNLQIAWDDPDTSADEGITYDTITFESIWFRIGNHFSKDPKDLNVSSADEGATFDIMLNFSIPKEEVPTNVTPQVPPHATAIPVIMRCDERWECSDWEPKECRYGGMQKRRCNDKNSCGTYEKKPSEEQECPAPPPPEIKPPSIEAKVQIELPFVGKFAISPYLVNVIMLLGAIILTIIMLWLLEKLLKLLIGKESADRFHEWYEKYIRRKNK